MTRNVKWRITAIVLLLMAVTNGMAQTLQDATKDVQKNITANYLLPIEERNELSQDPDLYCFPNPLAPSAAKPTKVKKASTTPLPTGTVKVCALLRPGDYSKYYKNRTSVGTPNLWVFEPNHTKTKFLAKAAKAKDWKRFCQFLGLEDTETKTIDSKNKIHIGKRDTIIYLEVPLTNLFRPAYNTDIYSKDFSGSVVSGKPTGEHYYKIVSSDQDINIWFGKQQYCNAYPWTRLGYTYDWGDTTNHFGATEFILKPGTYNTHTTNLKKNYKTVVEFLK